MISTPGQEVVSLEDERAALAHAHVAAAAMLERLERIEGRGSSADVITDEYIATVVRMAVRKLQQALVVFGRLTGGAFDAPLQKAVLVQQLGQLADPFDESQALTIDNAAAVGDDHEQAPHHIQRDQRRRKPDLPSRSEEFRLECADMLMKFHDGDD